MPSISIGELAKQAKKKVLSAIKSGLIPADSFGMPYKKFVLKNIEEKGGVALTYETLIVVTHESGEWIELYTAQTFNIPDNGYRFGNSPETGYQVVAQVAELEPVVVNYWDTKDLYVTRFLDAMYKSQLDSDNLLMPGYNSAVVTINDNGKDIKLLKVAVSRPKFESASAQNSLKMFSVVFNYEDYEESFEDSMNKIVL